MNLKKQTSRGVVKRSKEVLGPLIFRTTKTSVFSKNALSKFVSIVLDSFLGLLHLALTVSFVSLHLWKQRMRGGVGPLKGAVSAQKDVQVSETETREFLGGTKEESVSGNRGR